MTRDLFEGIAVAAGIMVALALGFWAGRRWEGE